jgi:Nuclease-related domain
MWDRLDVTITGPRKPGSWSIKRFKQQRRTAIRRGWRDWTTLVVIIGAMAVLTIWLSGWAQVFAAATFGFGVAVALVGWIIGGDVSSLPWAWGAVGEEQTASVISQLGSDWCCEHDVQYAYGNWDHILVGPPGIFMLESKRFLSSVAAVDGDELRAGRIRVRGSSFRGAAVGLKKALERAGVERPYVTAVVVIWGEFPQRAVQSERVTYLAGGELLRWLQQQPKTRDGRAVSEIWGAVSQLGSEPSKSR